MFITDSYWGKYPRKSNLKNLCDGTLQFRANLEHNRYNL